MYQLKLHSIDWYMQSIAKYSESIFNKLPWQRIDARITQSPEVSRRSSVFAFVNNLEK